MYLSDATFDTYTTPSATQISVNSNLFRHKNFRNSILSILFVL